MTKATFKVDDNTGNVFIYQENGHVLEFVKMSDAVNYCKENNIEAFPEEENEKNLFFQIGLTACPSKEVHHNPNKY